MLPAIPVVKEPNFASRDSRPLGTADAIGFDAMPALYLLYEHGTVVPQGARWKRLRETTHQNLRGMIGCMTATQSTLVQLLVATAQGDHASFARLYERTQLHLFGVAFRMLGNRASAEDVLQESFVNVWRSADSFRAEAAGRVKSAESAESAESVGQAKTPGGIGHDGQAMAWLTSIVRNRTLDVLRSSARRKEEHLPDADSLEAASASSSAVVDGAPSALEVFDDAVQKLKIDQCLGALDGSHRQCLALAYYQGLSSSEVAAQMKAPLGSVKSWIRRGLNKLRDCLADRGVVAEG
jgi:RNA polymerase sigma-70 factor, ECF subfamily